MKNSWVGASKTLEEAIGQMVKVPQIAACINGEHTAKTPERVTKAFGELFSGCWEDPQKVLVTSFSDDYDEMVFVIDISFVSMCAHHFLPFIGVAHFAYIPEKKIVGLSKIPRLVDVFARRPQVQEKLTKEITREFQRVVQPKGCGLVMEAYHLCMAIRGVKKHSAYTKTNDMQGVFRKHPEVRAEFLAGIPKKFRGL